MVLKNEVDKYYMNNLRKFLTKLQVGYKSRNVFIKLYLNSENYNIVNFFYEKNWIKMFFIKNNEIIVYLRYINNKPLFLNIKFISTPGHRKYYSNKSISYFKKNTGGNANVLLFTSFGLKNLKFVENLSIGGEIVCLLYE